MIIYKGGPIDNLKGESKDIDVRFSDSKNGLRDVLIGGGLVLIGVAYLTVTAFRNGAQEFEQAEYDTMDELGLFKN